MIALADALRTRANAPGVDFRDFGAKGDFNGSTGTDNLAAWRRATLALAGTKQALIVPPGNFYFSDFIEIKAGPLVIQGAGETASRFTFAQNKKGIILASGTTTGEGAFPIVGGYRANTTSGQDSSIRDLMIYSLGGTLDTAHGVWFRTQATMYNCRVQGFPGHGIYIYAASGSTADDLEGSANLWYLYNVNSWLNTGSGLFVKSADVNAGAAINCNFNHNGRWGVEDRSFLGNTYLGLHAATNGAMFPENPNNTIPCVVYHKGAQWYVIVDQDIAASTTEPGLTNLGVWGHRQYFDGGYALPATAWSNGGTYSNGSQVRHLNQGWSVITGQATAASTTAPAIGSTVWSFLGAAPWVRGSTYAATDIAWWRGAYWSIASGQAAAASTTEPAEGSSVWTLREYAGAPWSGFYPQWVSGTTYKAGGPYLGWGPSARNVFYGCYSESDQSPAQLLSPSTWQGGLHAAGVVSGSPIFHHWEDIKSIRRVSTDPIVATEIAAHLNGDPGAGDLLRFTHTDDFPTPFGLRRKAGGVRWEYGYSGSYAAFDIEGPNTTQQFGTGAPVPYVFSVPSIAIGTRRQFTSATIPGTTTGYAIGDKVWAEGPAAGGFAGWILTSTGWKTFGVISA